MKQLKFKLRDYQQQASDVAVSFFNDNKRENGIIVLPTGAGKSLVIADIANRLNSEVLVFQPSKEILVQNYEKMKLYTDDCSLYSASVNSKKISRITFAMIGSVKDHIKEFKHFKYVIVDECHGVSGEKGMYLNFLSMLDCKVLGLTATPYRLYSDRVYDKDAHNGYDENGNELPKGGMRTANSRLICLTNDENKFFDRVLYLVQVKELLAKGYLSHIQYFECRPPKWDETKIYINSSGSDFSNKSVQWNMEMCDFNNYLKNIVSRLLMPKNGRPANGILVFTQFVEDAEELCKEFPDHAAFISGKTTVANRTRIVNDFKEGKIKVLANVNCLSCGFDYPELNTVVLARPTMSLSMYYQQVGRIIRPKEGKEAWLIDMVGNSRRFGKVEDLTVCFGTETGRMEVFGTAYDYVTKQYGFKQLTGMIMDKQA